MNDVPVLNTPGRIAHLRNVPLHRVVHILNTRKSITPTALAGRVRLYDSHALAQIRYELNLQDARGGGVAVEN
ncbi:MAG TPA: hypothetical protein VM186_12845 [Planctomycetota bacterium]|nr:hypothetical protein [Planctomycetota bacterium]